MMEENQRTLEFAARFACEKGIARYTRFLDPVQEAEARPQSRLHANMVQLFRFGAAMNRRNVKLAAFFHGEKRLLRVIFRLFACIPVSLPNSVLFLIVIFWAHLWLWA
jgi:hypothetical protein